MDKKKKNFATCINMNLTPRILPFPIAQFAKPKTVKFNDVMTSLFENRNESRLGGALSLQAEVTYVRKEIKRSKCHLLANVDGY